MLSVRIMYLQQEERAPPTMEEDRLQGGVINMSDLQGEGVISQKEEEPEVQPPPASVEHDPPLSPDAAEKVCDAFDTVDDMIDMSDLCALRC